MPAGGLPKTQTVEGGGQIRVTRAGFTKLTQIIGETRERNEKALCLVTGVPGAGKTLVAFALGLTLFFVTLALNLVALTVVRRYREQYE